MNLNRADRVCDVLIHVRVETAPLVGRRGRNPIDQVNLEAAVHQMLDHAAPGLQVQDEWPLDQRVDEQQRYPLTRAAARRVMTEPDQT